MESVMDTINVRDVFGVKNEGSIYNYEGQIVDLREFNLQSPIDHYDILSGLQEKLKFTKICVVPSNGTLIVADTKPPTGFQTGLNTSEVTELITLFTKRKRFKLMEVEEVFILIEPTDDLFTKKVSPEDTYSDSVYTFPLSRDEMIKVSNCKPAIYKAIIAEKQNRVSDIKIAEDDSICETLRKIDVPTLKRFLTSVELSMLAEKVLPDNYMKAITLYENSISTNEYNVLARMNLGCIHAQKGSLKKALAHLEKAHEIAPGNRHIANNLAEIRENLENRISVDTSKIDTYKRKYYKTGELQCEFKFFNGKKNDITREYYKTGELKAEWVYDNDVLVNGCRGYYRTGELRCEYGYSNGKRNGVTTEYYKSGSIKAEWVYEDDVLVNGCKGYYETGELQYEYNFVNGRRNGITREYDKNGELKAEWMYNDDELIQ